MRPPVSFYLWRGAVREPWLRVSGIGPLEALDCRRKFFAAAAAGRITPVTSRLLTCQGLCRTSGHLPSWQQPGGPSPAA